MRSIDELLLLICTYFNENEIKYFIRGGIAVILQGRFRTTEDIDIILVSDTIEIEKFVEFCETNELSVDPYDLEQGKIDGSQMTIIDFPNGLRIDLKYVFTHWDKDAIENVDVIEYKGIKLRVCRPEYLILNKIYKGSRIDLEDAYSVLFHHKNRLDYRIMKNYAEFFEIVEEYQEFMKRANINK